MVETVQIGMIAIQLDIREMQEFCLERFVHIGDHL